ncbi:MAG: carbohydrate kinase [Bacteroidaceae bacterium]
MRKIIGIGETILDIVFKDGQPTAAVPGGSVFNGLVSLGRMGLDVSFIGEIGNDKVGEIIQQFMVENNISTQYVDTFPDGKSPISLAFLDNNNDADYSFYKDYPKQRLEVTFPTIEENDIVVFGSYYALNPALRERVKDFLDYATTQKAILYYDPNFRKSHIPESVKLAPAISENLEYATIVRGSDEDFKNMYNLEEVDKIYLQQIKYNCPNFICTSAARNIELRTNSITKSYSIPPIHTVSTIGAGDNFNAGIIYGLLKYEVTRSAIAHLDDPTWDKIIQCGIDFSANVCSSYNNSVSKEFAATY